MKSSWLMQDDFADSCTIHRSAAARHQPHSVGAHDTLNMAKCTAARHDHGLIPEVKQPCLHQQAVTSTAGLLQGGRCPSKGGWCPRDQARPRCCRAGCRHAGVSRCMWVLHSSTPLFSITRKPVLLTLLTLLSCAQSCSCVLTASRVHGGPRWALCLRGVVHSPLCHPRPFAAVQGGGCASMYLLA